MSEVAEKKLPPASVTPRLGTDAAPASDSVGKNLAAMKSENETLKTTLLLILAEPYGCPACDSGKLRSHKPHWDQCGFGKAQALLGVK